MLEQGAFAEAAATVEQDHQSLDFVVGRRGRGHEYLGSRWHVGLPTVQVHMEHVQLLLTANENLAQVQVCWQQVAIFRWWKWAHGLCRPNLRRLFQPQRLDRLLA